MARKPVRFSASHTETRASRRPARVPKRVTGSDPNWEWPPKLAFELSPEMKTSVQREAEKRLRIWPKPLPPRPPISERLQRILDETERRTLENTEHRMYRFVCDGPSYADEPSASVADDELEVVQQLLSQHRPSPHHGPPGSFGRSTLVFRPDERLLYQSTGWPARTVGRVYPGGTGNPAYLANVLNAGTGVLIGPTTLLTAGHLLPAPVDVPDGSKHIDEDQFLTSNLSFAPAAFVTATPFGRYGIRGGWTPWPPKWWGNAPMGSWHKRALDWAILELMVDPKHWVSPPFDPVGFVGTGTPQKNHQLRADYWQFGYPQDANAVFGLGTTLANTRASVLCPAGRHQLHPSSVTQAVVIDGTSYEAWAYHHGFDTAGGQSGGPYWRFPEDEIAAEYSGLVTLGATSQFGATSPVRQPLVAAVQSGFQTTWDFAKAKSKTFNIAAGGPAMTAAAIFHGDAPVMPGGQP